MPPSFLDVSNMFVQFNMLDFFTETGASVQGSMLCKRRTSTSDITNRRPPVEANNSTFNHVGGDQHNTTITHVESGRNDAEIIALRTERLIYRLTIVVLVGFLLLMGSNIALIFMYAISFILDFYVSNIIYRYIHRLR